MSSLLCLPGCTLCILGCSPRSSVYSRTDIPHSIITALGGAQRPAYSADATQFRIAAQADLPGKLWLRTDRADGVKQHRSDHIAEILAEQLSASGFDIEPSSAALLEVWVDWAGQIGGSMTDTNMRVVKVRLVVKARDGQGRDVLQGISDGMVSCTDLSWTRAVAADRYAIAGRQAVSKVVRQVRILRDRGKGR